MHLKRGAGRRALRSLSDLLRALGTLGAAGGATQGTAFLMARAVWWWLMAGQLLPLLRGEDQGELLVDFLLQSRQLRALLVGDTQ